MKTRNRICHRAMMNTVLVSATIGCLLFPGSAFAGTLEPQAVSATAQGDQGSTTVPGSDPSQVQSRDVTIRDHRTGTTTVVPSFPSTPRSGQPGGTITILNMPNLVPYIVTKCPTSFATHLGSVAFEVKNQGTGVAGPSVTQVLVTSSAPQKKLRVPVGELKPGEVAARSVATNCPLPCFVLITVDIDKQVPEAEPSGGGVINNSRPLSCPRVLPR